MDTPDRVLNWAQTQYPGASTAHCCAFGNAVAYLVAGASTGFGGPSLREYLCVQSLTKQLPRPGEWEFEAACAYCAPLCFNPPEHYDGLLVDIFTSKPCFDDDPDDLLYLRERVLSRSSQVSPNLSDAVVAQRKIAMAWLQGNEAKALILTEEYQCRYIPTRYCLHCGKALARQSRGWWCKEHRELSPGRVAYRRENKNKKKKTPS